MSTSLITRTIGSLALLGQVAWADEVSLIQDVKAKMAVNRPTQHTAATLLERASSMLKNGETEDVTDFVNAIAGQIIGTVVPSINNASAADQSLIYLFFSEFENIVGTLGADNVNEVSPKGLLERAASVDHKYCRDNEANLCTNKRACDLALFQKWTTWFNHEVDLSHTHEVFSGHFCSTNANGTLSVFRETASGQMRTYIEEESLTRTSALAYSGFVATCEGHYTALVDEGVRCNGLQTTLESHSCAYASAVDEANSEFESSWNTAVTAYNDQVIAVRNLQADRILEHTTLEVVKCLLDRVRSRAGQPCDEVTGEYQEELAKCHDVREAAEQNTTHLHLLYPLVPEIPRPCQSRDDVTDGAGVCLPRVQPWPCVASWIAQEYSMLPSMPEGPFTYANPSCNSPQTCAQCQLSEADVSRYNRNTGQPILIAGEPPVDPSPWTTVVDADQTHVITDVGASMFNQLFQECPVVRYLFNGQVHSVYVRTGREPINAYLIFTDTWQSEHNTLNEDFVMYSNLVDARAEHGRWTFCNYDESDVGYPRDCGRTAGQINQWFSIPGGRHTMRGRGSFEVYTARGCPAGAEFDASFETEGTLSSR